MNNGSLSCRSSRLARLQLPHPAKRIGIAITALAFVLLVVNATAFDNEVVRTIGKYGMLIGLLIGSISKELVEDELIVALRMRSYMTAFITGCLFSVAMPFVDLLVDMATGSDPSLEPMGDFMILWILLTVQLFSFEMLKRRA